MHYEYNIQNEEHTSSKKIESKYMLSILMTVMESKFHVHRSSTLSPNACSSIVFEASINLTYGTNQFIE